MSDDRLDACSDRGLDGLKLGLHASRRVLPFIGSDMTEGGLDVPDDGEALGGNTRGGTSEEAVGACEEKQEAGLHELRNLGGEAVVVTEAQFLDGDGVVLVDDRDDSGGTEQTGQRDTRVATATGVKDIVMREQQLGGAKAVSPEVAGIGGHERRLSHGGAGLLPREIGRTFGKLQGIDSRGHGSARNDDAGDSLFMESGDFRAEATELKFVEGAAPFLGQDSGAEFEDDGSLLHGLLF
jgi:hypothetical protein